MLLGECSAEGFRIVTNVRAHSGGLASTAAEGRAVTYAVQSPVRPATL
jgi:hypothetical protein